MRKWFKHEEEKFEEFKKKYLKELDENKNKDEFLEKVKNILKDHDLILLYSAKSEDNNGVVLKEWIEKNI